MKRLISHWVRVIVVNPYTLNKEQRQAFQKDYLSSRSTAAKLSHTYKACKKLLKERANTDILIITRGRYGGRKQYVSLASMLDNFEDGTANHSFPSIPLQKTTRQKSLRLCHCNKLARA